MLRRAYWFLPIILFILQLIYLRASVTTFKLEEFFDIRGSYWFHNRLVFNGGFAQVGWYAPMAVLYNIFGFSFELGKIFKSFLYLVSLLSLASILKKYLGAKRAIIPLLTVGLSPTLLFYTTVHVPWGVDLSYLPVCLYLVLSDDRWLKKFFGREVLLGAISVVAWFSYPTFFFYLPFIFILYLRRRNEAVKKLALVFTFFLTVFSIILWVGNRQTLIFDPNFKRGLFTGNGELSLNPAIWAGNIGFLTSDLFVRAKSYYFEVAAVEFSNFYPILGLLAIAVISYLKFKKYRLQIGFLSLALVGSLIVTNLTGPPTLGGVRRNTPVLVSIYLFFIFAWYLISKEKKFKIPRKFLAALMLLILVHHMIVYPVNLERLRRGSKFAETFWFARNGSYKETLNNYLETINKQDLVFSCVDSLGRDTYCTQLSIVYGTIKAACLWNHLSCYDILSYDLARNGVVKLDLGFFPNSSEP